MGTINNILNVKINNVSYSSSVNFGSTINIGAESNSRTIGSTSPIGDFSRNLDLERKNLHIDPHVVDQV